MEHILELQNVSKIFPKSSFSLNQISFALPYGTIMGFVGENGAGKTTTIDCILNTVSKNGGSITLFGKEMTDSDTAMREDIGVVYDGDNFPGYFSAKQLAAVMRGLYTQWDDVLFREYLKRFNLPPCQKIKTYSKGMTMKLAISAALSHRPKLLILDEATSGLDPVMRDDMLDVFLEFVQAEDHSILLSSHITADLERIADYITFIHDGNILLTVSKDELMYQYAVLRCKESQLERIDPADILACRKRELQTDVLVADKKSAARKYRDIVVDSVSIDEVLLLLAKGDCYDRTNQK